MLDFVEGTGAQLRTVRTGNGKELCFLPPSLKVLLGEAVHLRAAAGSPLSRRQSNGLFSVQRGQLSNSPDWIHRWM